MREGHLSQTVLLVATGACWAEARKAAECPATHVTVPTTEFPTAVRNPACRDPMSPEHYLRDDELGRSAQVTRPEGQSRAGAHSAQSPFCGQRGGTGTRRSYR